MYKYKKITIRLITISYVVLSIIELIKYLFTNSNIFGLIYLLITLFNIFLLVPVCYNYKKYYSGIRISKLIIIILIGVFSSYFLNIIVLNSIKYIDSSKEYIKSIYIIKNILKPIIYIFLLIFTILEYKLDKLISSKPHKKCTNKGKH